MDKSDFVKVLKDFRRETADILKICQKASGTQIQSRKILDGLETLATKWFESIEPILRLSFHFEQEELVGFREPFGKLLELSGGRPSKKVVLTILDSILSSYHADLLVPVQKHEILYAKFPSLETILAHAVELEVEYLVEAIECANLGKKRAAIVLGWCATINRLQLYIENEGFAKFNQASLQMHNIQTGRYKRFTKKFEIQNLSDLRMSVFDGDLLWVLEFLGAIDGNQHEKLEICFTMRNTSAHPGDANVSNENLLSFFSDIDSLVFSNARFSLRRNVASPQ
jgi:hypothetical protein